MSFFPRPLKNIIDYVKETQTDWDSGTGLKDNNTVKSLLLPRKGTKFPEVLKEFTNCESLDNIGWQICIVKDVPDHEDKVYVIYEFPRR